MTLTFTKGTVTTDGTEQTLFDTTSDNYFAAYVFLHNMVSGDTIEIRVYVLDDQASTMRLYDLYTKTGSQPSPALYLPTIPAREYKVTIKRTASGAGGDKVYNWLKAVS